MFKVAKAGDPIRDHVTATWFNHLNKRVFPPQQPNIPYQYDNPVRVRCFPYLPEYDMARFDPVFIMEPATPYEDIEGDALQYGALNVVITPFAVKKNWGILQGPCLVDTPTFVTVLGITWANFTLVSSSHEYVDIDDTAHTLHSADSGPARILTPPESAGKPGLILIQKGSLALELRIDGLNFQLSRDGGSTWETWATGAECP